MYDKIENKEDKAYIMYLINSFSFNQIEKHTGITKRVLLRLVREQKWDKIKKKVKEIISVYTKDNVLCSLLQWLALYARKDFLFIASLKRDVEDFKLDCNIRAVLMELEQTNEKSIEIRNFIATIYYADLNCFERVYDEIKDFMKQTKI